MFDALKRLGMIGIGAISLAEDELRSTIAELRKKGELSEEEGQKVMNEWRERVALNQREVKELVDKAVQDALKAVGAPSREEFDELAARLGKLESRLGEEQR
ncbi:MAG: phasin family protein [Phycisphaerae bacterium]|nr:phasin family protein [Phycisphaerae bacterium]